MLIRLRSTTVFEALVSRQRADLADQHRELSRCLAIVDKKLAANRQAFAQRLADLKAEGESGLKRLRKMVESMSECVGKASVEEREKQVSSGWDGEENMGIMIEVLSAASIHISIHSSIFPSLPLSIAICQSRIQRLCKTPSTVVSSSCLLPRDPGPRLSRVPPQLDRASLD